MTAEEALDTLIVMLDEIQKIAPAHEVPGLRAAHEMAKAARDDVDEGEPT